MQTLTEIFSEIGHFGSDIGCNDKNSNHSYLPTYDELFKPYQNGGAILEIGLALGDSIKLWDRYFDNGRIIGVDITVVFQPIDYKNEVVIIEADATNPNFSEKIAGETFNIIVDDGLHSQQSQVDSFNILKSFMKPGGIYIVEDILNINMSRPVFESLHDNCEIIDFQLTSGKFADCLVVYRF